MYNGDYNNEKTTAESSSEMAGNPYQEQKQQTNYGKCKVCPLLFQCHPLAQWCLEDATGGELRF